jgi:hypothetical protein
MTTSPIQPHKEMSTSALSASVLAKIEKERVAPIPRWRFLFIEYSIWFLWGLSVLIGAVAFSVMLFFSMHARFGFYEAMHESTLMFFLEMVPYAWVLVFVCMAILAHYNLRHTKHGYKYGVWRILVSSILCSFLAGFMLHAAGMGFLIDTFVAKRLPALPALQTIEARMWQSPEHGRMLGVYQGETEDPEVIHFIAKDGASWKVDTTELNPLEVGTLYSGEPVRLIGIVSTTTPAYFHGCGVFLWAPHTNPSLSELREQRQHFVERLRLHKEMVLEDLMATGTIPEYLYKPVCSSYDAVHRLKSR